jgi:hypothetical protein
MSRPYMSLADPARAICRYGLRHVTSNVLMIMMFAPRIEVNLRRNSLLKIHISVYIAPLSFGCSRATPQGPCFSDIAYYTIAQAASMPCSQAETDALANVHATLLHAGVYTFLLPGIFNAWGLCAAALLCLGCWARRSNISPVSWPRRASKSNID